MTVHLHQWFHRKQRTNEVKRLNDRVYSHVHCGEDIEIPDKKVDGCQLSFSIFPEVVWDDQLDKVTCAACKDAYGWQVLGEL